MYFEEVVKTLDELIFARTGMHLSILKIEILKYSWQNLTYSKMAQTFNLSQQHVKDTGYELWHQLSMVLGKKINKNNFPALMESWLQLSSQDSLKLLLSKVTLTESVISLLPKDECQKPCIQIYQDWGDKPEIDVFCGRISEITTLKRWIVNDCCRLLVVWGMGGIGKTYLSLKLASEIQDQFEYLIWRRLINAPSITEILTDLIKFFSNQQELYLPDTLEGKISRLLHYLQEHRCLLILDNWETVIQRSMSLKGGVNNLYAEKYLEEYEGYNELLNRLGKTFHQSSILITSREKPQNIALMEGKKRPVRCFKLSGLNNLDGQKIFTELGSFSGSNEEWKKLIKFYKGNPLALELAAKHIIEVFDGNISSFLIEGQKIFIEIRDLLDWYFEYLSDCEKELMYWFAINREPVTISELKEDILSPVFKENISSTLQLLQRRLPLENNSLAFTVQPVIMHYLTERLIEQVCEEIIMEKIKILNSHALLKASAKDYVRESQISLILKPCLDRLLNTLGNKSSVEEKLKQIILKLQQESHQKIGYAAGNILNMLCQLKTEIKGCDFSGLTVYQAYLQGINLQQVNFAYSDLSKSSFAEIFSSVLSVKFSQDGKLLATSDAKAKVHLWEVANGKKLLTFEGHNWLRSVDFSSNSMTLAGCGEDKIVYLWDVKTGQCFRSWTEHSDYVWSVTFSPSDTILASASSDQTIRLWDVNTGQCIKTLLGHTNCVRSIDFSPDGTTLASGSDDQTVKLWDINTGQCIKTLLGHTKAVTSVTFSLSDTILASASSDQTIRLWDVNTGQCIKTLLGHTNCVHSIDFSPDGITLASGSDDQTVKLWDINTGQCIKTLLGHNSWVRAVAFNFDAKTLVTGGYDQKVKLWSVSNGKCIKTLQGRNSGLESVAFNPNGQILAAGSENKIVYLWNINTGLCFKTLHGHTNWVWSVAFSSNGWMLASGSEDKTVRLWDIYSGQCCKTLLGHTSWIWSVRFDPTGKILASASDDQTVRLWDIYTGLCFKTLWGHTSRVWAAVFSPDGTTLASASDDQTIRLWDVSTGQCLKILKGHTKGVWSIAFSSNSKLLASGSEDCTVKLWDLDMGQCLETFEGHTNWLWSVAFSPDSRILATGSEDETVRLWDLHTGQSQVLSGHTARVRSVAFSPNGDTISSASEDETIIIWNVKTAKYLKTLRVERPYEGMNLTGVNGLNDSQKNTLKALGAFEFDVAE
ncbi:MAG: NB-ARC domain-containing protein [Dendronalium sp. ChiSLP03b]